MYVFAATRGSLSTACSSASHPWLTYWSVDWLGRPDHHYSLERHTIGLGGQIFIGLLWHKTI